MTISRGVDDETVPLEFLLHQKQDVGGILDEQNPDMRLLGGIDFAWWDTVRHFFRCRDDSRRRRKRDDECAALPKAAAFRPNFPRMQFGDLPGDRKSKAE